jgi:CBS domain containing-hemolysin-like protein
VQKLLKGEAGVAPDGLLRALADGTGQLGGTLGLVTMEDILEELVGDIWDESDEIVEECVRTGENTYEVNGDMNIDDFFAEIEFEPRDFECEYSTVGGWAIEMLDADPHVGDSFSYRDIPLEEGEEEDPEDPATTLTVDVSAMDEMRVTKLTVLVSRPETAEGEDK